LRLSILKLAEAAADVLCSKQQGVFNMQAADLLAIEEHVQDVCAALAARMFDATATCHTTGMQEFPKQVFLRALMTLRGTGWPFYCDVEFLLTYLL
jgi:hypothetical protein